MVVNLTLGWRQINRLVTVVRKFCPLGRFYLRWLLIVCVNIIRILSHLLCCNVAESKSSHLSGKKRHFLLGEDASEETKNSWLDGSDGSSVDTAKQIVKVTLTKRQKAGRSCSSFWCYLLLLFICLWL
jgi:hypothetical protein